MTYGQFWLILHLVLIGGLMIGSIFEAWRPRK